jgi:auxin-responsive protein IAA
MEGATAAASFLYNLKATELRLGLPGSTEQEEPQKTAAAPRPSMPRGKKRDGSSPEEVAKAAPPAAK